MKYFVKDLLQKGCTNYYKMCYSMSNVRLGALSGNGNIGNRYIRVSFSIPTEEVMQFRKEFKNAVLTLQEKKGIK